FLGSRSGRAKRGPEPITTKRSMTLRPCVTTRLVVMDSGLAAARRPGMTALAHPLRQPPAQKKLPNARIGKNLRRRVGDARAAKLEHDAVVGGFERALGVLLDQQHRDAAAAHFGEDRE